jgi:cyclopropane fatty-acyl-phospholipid synthase-like methyltransferase
MNLFKHLSFELWYLRHPPWESGIVPPELIEFIGSHPPGRALDLGCGSGTSSLALAKGGWTVCGVDYARGAIHRARQKNRLTGLAVDFHLCDVTRLPPSILLASYDLVLDIGCFHGLSLRERDIYLETLEHLIAPGGCWLMYGFFNTEENPVNGSTDRKQNEPGKRLKLTWRRDGMEMKDRPSAWFCYRV